MSDAEAGFKKIDGSIAGFAKGAGLALAGAGLAIGAAGGFAVAAAGDFEKTMSGVKAVSGATATEMKGLSGLALQLGKDTSFSASEAAAGIEELVKGGLSISDVMGGAAAATLNLAAAGGVSLPEAATIAANALAQFNLKGGDMAHVADLIAGAANASAIDVSQFKLSLQAAGAVAATVGFKFDDLATGIAVMGKAGIVGSDAGTSLKTMMMNLSPQTDKARKLMKQLGIITKDGANQFFDAGGHVKSMAEVAQILQTSLKDLTDEQKLNTLTTLFGSDAVRAGAVLTKEGAAGFREMAGSMGKVTAASVGLERLNNLWGDVEQLKGSAETLAITFGTVFLPALRDGAKWATGFVNSLIPWVERIGPQAVEWLGKVGGAFTAGGLLGAFKTVAADAATFGGTLLTWAADLAPKLVTAVGGWAAALTGWVVDRIPAVLVALGTFATATWDWITKTALPTLVARLGEWGSAFVGWIGPKVPAIFAAYLKMEGAFLGWLATTALAIGTKLLEWGAAFVGWLAPRVGPLLVEAGKLASALWTWITTTALPTIAAKLGAWGTAFVNWVGPVLVALPGRLGELAVAVWTWITDTALPAIVTKLGVWKDAFLGWVTPLVTALPAKLGELKDRAIAWIVDTAPIVLARLGAWKDAFLDWIGPVLLAIPGKLGELKDKVISWVGNNWRPILDKLGAWKDAFLDWIGPIVLALPAKLGAIKDAAVTWITGTGIPAIKVALDGLETVVVPAFVNAFTKARDAMKPVWAEITLAMSDFEPTGKRIERLLDTIGRTVTDVVKPALFWLGGWMQAGAADSGGWMKRFADAVNHQTKEWELMADQIGRALGMLKDVYEWTDKLLKLGGINITIPDPPSRPGAVGGTFGPTPGGGITTVPIGAGGAKPRAGEVVREGPDAAGKYLYASDGGRHMEWRDLGGPGVAGRPYAIGVPEVFVPDRGGQFYPLGGAGGGGGPTTIPVYIGGELITTVVAKASQRYANRGGR